MNPVALIASRLEAGAAQILGIARFIAPRANSFSTDASITLAAARSRTHTNTDVRDQRDAEDLNRVLREQVMPLYYERDGDGLPRGSIRRMKRTIRTFGWRFNVNRMITDYTLKAYIPAAGGASSDMSQVE
jgi:hypothetical protein